MRLEYDGGAAGTLYYRIQFTNVSAHSCQLRGYPGVSAYGGGHQIGNSATWDGPIGVSTVTLAHGATAHSMLGIHNGDSYPAELCGKVTATSLRVYPPDETAALYLPFRFNACTATGSHQLVGWPVQAGSGNPAPAPSMKQLVVPFGSDQWRVSDGAHRPADLAVVQDATRGHR